MLENLRKKQRALKGNQVCESLVKHKNEEVVWCTGNLSKRGES